MHENHLPNTSGILFGFFHLFHSAPLHIEPGRLDRGGNLAVVQTPTRASLRGGGVKSERRRASVPQTTHTASQRHLRGRRLRVEAGDVPLRRQPGGPLSVDRPDPPPSVRDAPVAPRR